ncbi:MAG TPA: heparinase II/III family protein, partial [Prolixibacteraceae bacterium]|nr:heparinase II/III family protein [Prolixibacteraceae bacterium]
DQVATDRSREIEALWHWHPDCVVQIDGNKVVTNNEKGNLQIIPVNGPNWQISMVKGQEKPEIQGWYSREYNQYVPSPTSVYTTRIDSDATFAWVLFPSEKSGTALQTEIVSANNQEMKIRVVTKNGQEWLVSVPLPAEAFQTGNR